MAVGCDRFPLIFDALAQSVGRKRDTIAALAIVVAGYYVYKVAARIVNDFWVHFGTNKGRQKQLLRAYGSWAILNGCCGRCGKYLATKLASCGISLILIDTEEQRNAIAAISNYLLHNLYESPPNELMSTPYDRLIAVNQQVLSSCALTLNLNSRVFSSNNKGLVIFLYDFENILPNIDVAAITSKGYIENFCDNLRSKSKGLYVQMLTPWLLQDDDAANNVAVMSMRRMLKFNANGVLPTEHRLPTSAELKTASTKRHKYIGISYAASITFAIILFVMAKRDLHSQRLERMKVRQRVQNEAQQKLKVTASTE